MGGGGVGYWKERTRYNLKLSCSDLQVILLYQFLLQFVSPAQINMTGKEKRKLLAHAVILVVLVIGTLVYIKSANIFMKYKHELMISNKSCDATFMTFIWAFCNLTFK